MRRKLLGTVKVYEQKLPGKATTFVVDWPRRLYERVYGLQVTFRSVPPTKTPTAEKKP